MIYPPSGWPSESGPTGGGPGTGGAPVTPPSGRSVSVGTSSTLVAPDRPTRKKISIQNDSDTIIYLVKGSTAIINSSLRLNPDGGSLVDEPDAKGYFYTGAWAAISSAASKLLLVSEEI